MSSASMEALPFGSTSILADPLVWFDENWMFVGLVSAFGVLLVSLRRLPTNSMAMWGYLSVWVYSLHQFEEHGYDMLGRRYSFLEYLNSTIASKVGFSATPRFVTIVNVVQVQIAFLLYAWLSERSGDPSLPALSWAMALVNSIAGHLGPAATTGIYNPGALQSAFMAPAAVYFLYRTGNVKGPKAVLLALLGGSVYGHGIALLAPAVLLGKGILGNWGHLAWVVVASLLPVAVLHRENKSHQAHKAD